MPYDYGRYKDFIDSLDFRCEVYVDGQIFIMLISEGRSLELRCKYRLRAA